LPKSVAANFLPNGRLSRVAPWMKSIRSIHAGNEWFYARAVFFSRISHIGEPNAVGRLLD